MPRIRIRPLLKPAITAPRKLVTPDSYPNIRSIFDYESIDDKVVSELNTHFDQPDGYYYQERLDRIESSLTDIDETTSLDVGNLDRLLKTGKRGFISNASEQIDIDAKEKGLYTRMQAYSKNLHNRNRMKRGFTSFFDDDLRAIEFDYQNTYKQFDIDGIKPLQQKYKGELKTFQRVLGSSPRQFGETYGATQADVVGAMMDGNTDVFSSNAPIVKDFAKSVHQSYQSLINSLFNQGQPVNPSAQKNFIPFDIPMDVLNYTSADDFISLLKTHTNLEEADIEGLLYQYKQSVSRGGMRLSSNIRRRDLKFKSGKDAVSFFGKLNGWTEDTNVFGEYYNAVRRRVKKHAFYTAYGNDPLALINKASTRLKKDMKLKDRGFEDAVFNYEKKLLQFDETMFKHDDWVNNTASIFSQAVGLFTHAPITSSQRNNLIDFNAHAVSVGKSIYTPAFGLGKAVQSSFRGFADIFSTYFKGQPEIYKKILDISSFANSFDGIAHGTLGLYENIGDGTADILRTMNTVSGKWNQAVSNLTAKLYRIGGNDTLVDSKRARATITMQQMWTTNFDNFNNFDEWFKVISVDNPAQARQLAGTWGIDKNVWGMLKDADRFAFDDPDIPDMITRDTILNSPDHIALRHKLPNESPRQFKERVAYLWQRLNYNLMQNQTPTPTYTDSLTKHLKNIPSAPLYIMLRGAMKFADPAHAQWVNFTRQIARIQYGDTSTYLGSVKAVSAFGRAMMPYLAFNASLRWMKDAMSNREFTDFKDPKNATILVLTSGLGGYTGSLLANFFNIYESGRSQNILGATPATSAYERLKRVATAPLGDSSTKKYDTAKALSDAIPLSSLWGAKGLLDYSLRHTLLTPAQNDVLLQRRETYGRGTIIE